MTYIHESSSLVRDFSSLLHNHFSCVPVFGTAVFIFCRLYQLCLNAFSCHLACFFIVPLIVLQAGNFIFIHVVQCSMNEI